MHLTLDAVAAEEDKLEAELLVDLVLMVL